MNVVASEAVSDFQTFAEAVKVSAEPVVVTAGGAEYLVAMSPDVFEQILFDTNLLSCERARAVGYC